MIKKKIIELINDKNKINFFIYGLGQSFNLLSPLLVAPLIISVCGVASFGKVGLGFALALFLILIVDYSFDIKGTKQVAENRNNPLVLQNILNTAIFTKFFLFVISQIVAGILIFLIPFFHQEKALFFISMTIVLAQVFNPIWFLQGVENFKLVSIINSCSKTLYVILLFCFITQKADYIWVNFFLGMSSLLLNSVGLIIIKNKYHFTIEKPSIDKVKNIIKTDFSFCLSQLFLSVRQLSPLVLSGYFLGFTLAGYYKVIEQIITLFRTFIQVFLKFFYPRACYKFLQDKNTGFVFWKKYTLLNIVFVFVSIFIIFLFSDPILAFFHLTPIEIDQLLFAFKFSLLISLLMAFSLPLEQLMFITNKNKVYIRITIFVTVLNVVLLLILINLQEISGIIISLLISEVAFISLYFYNTLLKVKQKPNNESSYI